MATNGWQLLELVAGHDRVLENPALAYSLLSIIELMRPYIIEEIC